jgi:hypothetical protein
VPRFFVPTGGDQIEIEIEMEIEIEIEIEVVYIMYRMRRFTTRTVCAGCCLWALPTMPYMKLTSKG